MKNFLSSFRLRLVPLSLALVAIMAFSGCKKMLENDDQNSDLAGVMAFNLAPDQPYIGFALSGSVLNNAALNYSGYTGIYLPVYPGNRMIESFEYGGSAILDTTIHFFQPQEYYSIFLTGRAGNYQNIVVNDDFDSLTAASGQAYIRYVNAIEGATPELSITSQGSNVVNQNVEFNDVSGFTAVTPGDLGISVSNGGTVSAERTISVEAKKVYTILLMGIPGETDDLKKVQIRFVNNGTVTDEQ